MSSRCFGVGALTPVPVSLSETAEHTQRDTGEATGREADMGVIQPHSRNARAPRSWKRQEACSPRVFRRNTALVYT